MLTTARGYLESGRFAQGYAIYQSLMFGPPGRASLVPEVVQLLFQRGALAEAETLAERAAERFPEDAAVWLQLGHARQKIGRAEPALEAYQTSLQRDAGSAHAWAAIAQVYERLHRLDEAMEAMDKAADLMPESHYLVHCRGVLLRRMGRLDEALEAQQAVLSVTHERDGAMQHLAWREISAVHRAADDAEASRVALAKSKTAQAPLRAPYLHAFKDYQREIESRFAGFDAVAAQAWHQDPADSGGVPALRQAFIVGHPRSGTTLTQQILAAHPDVLTLDEQEALPHVEASMLGRSPSIDDLRQLTHTQREQFVHLYRAEAERYLGSPVNGRLLIDKRPDSLLMLPTILRTMPSSKVLVVLRDPRDVCASCYRQAFDLGVVSAQFHSIESTCRYYAWFMSHWLTLRRILPAEMWHEVQYEALVSDLENTSRGVLDFLGLAWDETVLSYQDQAARRLVSTPSYAAVARPVHRDAIGGWRAFADEFDTCAPTLAPYLQA